MLTFLILLLAIRLTTSDKLDRTYLPPPGAKLSGGSPEELEVPLEFPKESYQTSIEPQSELNFENPNDDPTLPIDILIGNHNNGVKNTRDEYSFESYSNTPSNLNSYNEVTTRMYSTDVNETTLDSNQAFPQHNVQILGPISYQTNGETDFYQNQRLNNLELYNQTGNQPTLPINLFLKHQSTDNVQKHNISAMSDSESIMPDIQIDASSKHNKDKHILQTYPSKNNMLEFGKSMDSNNENALSMYGKNNNNEGYKAYNKYNDDESELTTVNITPTDNFLEDLPPAYLSLSMQEIGKENIGTQNIIINHQERPQAAADRDSVILNYKNVITPEGLAYSFDSSNGIHADENGTAVNGVKAQGSFSYTGDDGKVYSVIYTADENGFLPRGDHLPTPPPLPKFVQQLIQEAAKHEEVGKSDDGSYDEAKYGYKKYQRAMDYYSPDIQGISFEGIKLIGTKRKMNIHRRPVKVANHKPSKYEDYNKTQYDNEHGDTEFYNNELLQRPINKLPENDTFNMKSVINENNNLMRAKIPVLKDYTIDRDQHKDTFSFKKAGTGGIPDKQTMQPDLTLTNNKYYDKNLDMITHIVHSENKNLSPVYKLNDEEINLSSVNLNEKYGSLNNNSSSFYEDLNSGYHYEKPEIKLSYKFNKKPINSDERNHFKHIIHPSKSSNGTQMAKLERANINQEGNNTYFNEDKVPIFNKILGTGIGGRPQIIQSIQEENIDNNDKSSTTPMSTQNPSAYSEAEYTTMKTYPTMYKTSVLPLSDHYHDIKATEYPDEVINPSAIPPRSDIFNGFVNPNANVIVDVFGRPVTTEQPDREFTGYAYGPVTINEMIYTNLPSTIMYKDETEDSVIYPFIVTGSPFDVIKNLNIQETGLKENQEKIGRPIDFAGITTVVFDEHHSTTERLIGEDFSGPKRPQSYDPKTGYIYK